MNLKIHTLEKTLFDGNIKMIIIKTTTGEITVLPEHIPLISTLQKGDVRVIDDSGKETKIFINGGVLEIQPESRVVILAES